MKNQKNKTGSTIKMLTVLAGIVGLVTMVINDRLEEAKLEDIKETARNEAREEVKKALAEKNDEEEA
jgi:DNA-binding cell septation regulator SpoVG